MTILKYIFADPFETFRFPDHFAIFLGVDHFYIVLILFAFCKENVGGCINAFHFYSFFNTEKHYRSIITGKSSLKKKNKNIKFILKIKKKNIFIY